jgi:hypothetical protein
VELAEKLLHQQPRHPRAGVDRGEDEQRLEHDREVVPEVLQPAHAGEPAEDLRDPDGERYRASRTAPTLSPTADSRSGRTTGIPGFANASA